MTNQEREEGLTGGWLWRCGTCRNTNETGSACECGRPQSLPVPAEVLRRIGLHADVMIGNGEGAVDAYYRKPGRVAEGLPTQFGQMRDHAKQIRLIVQDALDGHA